MDILEEDILEGGEYSHEDVLDGCQGGYSWVYTGTSRTANNFHWKKPCEGFLVKDSLVSVLVCEYGNKLLHFLLHQHCLHYLHWQLSLKQWWRQSFFTTIIADCGHDQKSVIHTLGRKIVKIPQRWKGENKEKSTDTFLYNCVNWT